MAAIGAWTLVMSDLPSSDRCRSSKPVSIGNTSTAERPDGFGQVMGFFVRVAGRVPTRVGLQHAGTPECQVGLWLGTVLAYLRSHDTVQIIAGPVDVRRPSGGLTGRAAHR
ncbi:hypothetical protein LWC35_31825 [Pseudonocardia kujensis]|uniref:hypothetical protein n=1 Tax=Pseudonocardia kujensis TaxID=1128675 RepID=UPI001E32ACE5|nr:hypothetical protein [Pseudonocardia kujensis]MCE0767453.1 hypothetical protein [Pseudonocardia kujensis]